MNPQPSAWSPRPATELAKPRRPDPKNAPKTTRHAHVAGATMCELIWCMQPRRAANALDATAQI